MPNTNTRAGKPCNCPEGVPGIAARHICMVCRGNITHRDKCPHGWLTGDPNITCPQCADVYDATYNPDIDELAAQTTRLDAAGFQQWLASEGQLYIVYLPMRKSFIIKVPEAHHPFFVDMMKQLRMTLGPDVQAASAQPVNLEADQ